MRFVGELGFNYEDDAKEFGCGSVFKNQKVVRLNRYTDDNGEDVIAISFELGRKTDDTMTVSFPWTEFLSKVINLIPEP